MQISWKTGKRMQEHGYAEYLICGEGIVRTSGRRRKKALEF